MGYNLMPICTKCRIDIPGTTQDGQDKSTFICAECQDKVNLKVWKEEAIGLKDLEKNGKVTVSQIKRLEKLNTKVKNTVV